MPKVLLGSHFSGRDLCSIVSAQQTTATVTGPLPTRPEPRFRVSWLRPLISRLTPLGKPRPTRAAAIRSRSCRPANIPLTPSALGFQAQKTDGLILQVQQVARLNIQLKIGEVTETVTVEGSAASLQTDNATLGTVIDGDKIVASAA